MYALCTSRLYFKNGISRSTSTNKIPSAVTFVLLPLRVNKILYIRPQQFRPFESSKMATLKNITIISNRDQIFSPTLQ